MCQGQEYVIQSSILTGNILPYEVYHVPFRFLVQFARTDEILILFFHLEISSTLEEAGNTPPFSSWVRGYRSTRQL